MTRRLRVTWPDAGPFRSRDGRPIRILAASDEPDPALDHERNRDQLGHPDFLISCGDLEAAWLAFLGDAFHAPIVRVLGNHDVRPDEPAIALPEPLLAGVERRLPLPVVGLSWPGQPPKREPGLAWAQALRVASRQVGRGPAIVASHVAPSGVGDSPDRYHRGFLAYRWLLGLLRPPLWLHGHTTLASTTAWRLEHGDTVVANVTGSILIEVHPPGSR